MSTRQASEIFIVEREHWYFAYWTVHLEYPIVEVNRAYGCGYNYEYIE